MLDPLPLFLLPAVVDCVSAVLSCAFLCFLPSTSQMNCVSPSLSLRCLQILAASTSMCNSTEIENSGTRAWGKGDIQCVVR